MELEQALTWVNQAVMAHRGKPLTQIELAVIRGSCQGQTYEAIATATSYSASYLSRTFCPQLWQLLTAVLEMPVSKKSLATCLATLSLDRAFPPAPTATPVPTSTLTPLATPDAVTPTATCDWGEAIDVSVFYGRDYELAKLQEWSSQDRCRLIAILGMGGIGKTALSVKLAQQLQTEFDFVIWRSLRNAPSLETLLTDLVTFLSDQQETQPELGKLVNCLRQSRCLVILDNLETLLDAERVGQFRPGFENYGELLRSLGEVGHQSCIVLTSREKPAEVAALEGTALAVRSVRLDGSIEAAQAILQAKGLRGTAAERQALADRYGNSPLALKIIATSIQELFDGSIGDFLQEDTLIFNGIRRLLDQQFQRLSELEKSIMYWLAINREWTGIAELQADIIPNVSKGHLLENLEALSFRCLTEQQGTRFTQQPVVMEYITEQILETVMDELSQSHLNVLLTHALLKATSQDYIRETQKRLFLAPLCDRLLDRFQTAIGLIQHLHPQFTPLRATTESNYGAGNLINLLSYLNADLCQGDFSNLTIRQADLRDTPLQQTNFSKAHFAQTSFADPVTDINNMAVSPDGETLVMMGLNGTVFLYQMATGQRLAAWSAHQNWSFGVTFAPEGKTLFTSSFDQTLKQWDIATRHCLNTWQTDSPVWQIALSAEGEWLASAHENGTVQLRHLPTDTVTILTEHKGTVRDLAFHPHRNLLASASTDRTVKFWNPQTGKCVSTLADHTDALWAIRFNPQGTILISICADQGIKVWDVQTGECLKTLHIKTIQINQAASFGPNGKLLAIACQDTTIRLWDIEHDRPLRVLQGHRMGVWGLAFSHDGKTLISSSGSAQVKFWQVESGQCVKTLQGEMQGVWDIAFNQQRTRMVSVGDDARLRLWSLSTGKCEQILSGHGTRIVAAAYHPAQPWVATASYDCLVKLWDLQQGHCIRTFKGHRNWAVGVAFHPTEPWLLSCGYDNTIRIWAIATGELMRTIDIGSAGYVFDVAFHPQEPWFFSSSEDGIVRCWDSLSGQLLREFSGHTARVWQLAFHPQGQLLATGGHDGTVQLWDVKTGDCVAIWEGFGVVMAVCFSPDGRLLAANSDHLIRLWDVESQQPLHTLEGHSNVISTIAFQPHVQSDQGYTLVSGSYDETIRFWQTETGECLQVLRPDRLYEGMNIAGITGLSAGQTAILNQLGAAGTCDRD
jgi:WD40 repeat protein